MMQEHELCRPPLYRATLGHDAKSRTQRSGAGHHPAQPLRRGHRRVRGEHRDAADVALACPSSRATSPEPLPNLDFKVRSAATACSGRTPASSTLNVASFEQSGLGTLKASYLLSSTVARRTGCGARSRVPARPDTDGARDASAVPAGSVDWRVEFAEVFARRRVRHRHREPARTCVWNGLAPGKEELARAYPDVHASRADYLVYFSSGAYSLFGKAVSSPSSRATASPSRGYGKKLRGYLASNLTIRTLIDFGELSVDRSHRRNACPSWARSRPGRTRWSAGTTYTRSSHAASGEARTSRRWANLELARLPERRTSYPCFRRSA